MRIANRGLRAGRFAGRAASARVESPHWSTRDPQYRAIATRLVERSLKMFWKERLMGRLRGRSDFFRHRAGLPCALPIGDGASQFIEGLRLDAAQFDFHAEGRLERSDGDVEFG